MNDQTTTTNNQDTRSITVNIVVKVENADSIVNQVMERLTPLELTETEMQMIYEKILEKLAMTNLQTSYGLNNPMN